MTSRGKQSAGCAARAPPQASSSRPRKPAGRSEEASPSSASSPFLVPDEIVPPAVPRTPSLASEDDSDVEAGKGEGRGGGDKADAAEDDEEYDGAKKTGPKAKTKETKGDEDDDRGGTWFESPVRRVEVRRGRPPLAVRAVTILPPPRRPEPPPPKRTAAPPGTPPRTGGAFPDAASPALSTVGDLPDTTPPAPEAAGRSWSMFAPVRDVFLTLSQHGQKSTAPSRKEVAESAHGRLELRQKSVGGSTHGGILVSPSPLSKAEARERVLRVTEPPLPPPPPPPPPIVADIVFVHGAMGTMGQFNRLLEAIHRLLNPTERSPGDGNNDGAKDKGDGKNAKGRMKRKSWKEKERAPLGGGGVRCLLFDALGCGESSFSPAAVGDPDGEVGHSDRRTVTNSSFSWNDFSDENLLLDLEAVLAGKFDGYDDLFKQCDDGDEEEISRNESNGDRNINRHSQEEQSNSGDSGEKSSKDAEKKQKPLIVVAHSYGASQVVQAAHRRVLMYQAQQQQRQQGRSPQSSTDHNKSRHKRGCGESDINAVGGSDRSEDESDGEMEREMAGLVLLSSAVSSSFSFSLFPSCDPAKSESNARCGGVSKAADIGITDDKVGINGARCGGCKAPNSTMTRDGGPCLFRLPSWLLRFLKPKYDGAFLDLAYPLPSSNGKDKKKEDVDNSEREDEEDEDNWEEEEVSNDDCSDEAVATQRRRKRLRQNQIQKLRTETAAIYSQNDLSYAQAFYRQSRWVSPSDASDVLTKSLVVHGSSDMILPAKECGEVLYEALPDAEFVEVKGAGHFVMEERPMEVARVVLRFIGEVLEEKRGK